MAVISLPKPIQRPGRVLARSVSCYQFRQLALASVPFFRARLKLKHKLLFAYREKGLYDHELYSLLLRSKESYGNISYLAFAPEERPRSDLGLSAKKLVRKIQESNPDMVFAFDNMLALEEVEYIKSRNIKLCGNNIGVHSFYCGGPPMTQVDTIQQLRLYDWYLVHHVAHIPRLKQEGINVLPFPLWYDPLWFRPLGLNKEYDILFVGDLTTPLNTNRGEMLQHLSSRFNIALLSGKDPQIPKVRYLGQTTDPRRLNKFMNKAKLVIGSDRLAEPDVLNVIPGQYIFYDDKFSIRERTYLVLGAGTCYLVERHPAIEEQFVDGKEIVLWDNYQDLCDKIARLLKDDAQREGIAREGHRRAETEYSTPVRAKQLFRIMGLVD